jgi:hypothetical protein
MLVINFDPAIHPVKHRILIQAVIAKHQEEIFVRRDSRFFSWLIAIIL